MTTNALTRKTNIFPSFTNEFFKPWNEWFDSDFEKRLSLPAVNIIETDKQYDISVAAPGMKKDDFKIDVVADVLTISAAKEETKEEMDKQYNRREYNYSSFSRSFTLPDGVKQDKIEAKYENGVLTLLLPKNDAVKAAAKTIAVK